MPKVQAPSLFNKTTTFAELSDKWELVDTLYGGTDAMRDAGRLYLKQNPAESLAKYRDRLSRATLTNRYKKSIKQAVGKAFASKMNVKLPIGLQQLVINADGTGTSLETFSKNAMDNAINYGITYLLVDYPQATGDTLAAQRESGAFPYFVEIKPTQLLELRVEYINNKAQLTYFRFYEELSSYEPGLLGAESTEQVREFTLEDDGSITYAIYRKEKNKPEVLYDAGVMVGMGGIPIIPIYGNKTQSYMGEPVLMDLAHLNVKHWWKQSDLDWNEHFGLTPILKLEGIDLGTDPETGASKIDSFVVGASTVVAVPTGGNLAWTTADASGIAAAQTSLDRLLKEMDESGLELTSPQSNGAETATGRLIDAAESNSILKGIVLDFVWQLYQAVIIAGEYIGIDASNADISLDTTYTVSGAANTSDMPMLLSLVEKGVITVEEMRAELQSRRVFVSEKVAQGLGSVPDSLVVVTSTV